MEMEITQVVEALPRQSINFRLVGQALFILIFVFCIWVRPAQAGLIVHPPSYLGLQRGLVGCWTFDGAYSKAPDCSGNNNTGTLTNGPIRAEGQLGEALSFDGVSKYVSIPDAAYNFNGNYTVSAWVKPTSFPSATEDILSKIHSSGPTDVFLVEVDNTSGQLRHLLRNGSGTVFDVNSGTTNLVLNTWQHVIVTYDTSLASANAKIYLNGVQVGNGNATAVATITSVPIEIGRINLSGDFRYWNGSIDDVRIFNRALSSSEIARMYKIGLGSKQNRAEGGDSLDKGLVGHWDFDGRNISGTRAKDSSGQNNHGTLTNGPVQAEGVIGQALSFDGVNDYVSVSDSNSLDVTSDITLSALVKVTNYTSGFGDALGTVINKGTYAPPTNYIFRVNTSGFLNFAYHDGSGYQAYTANSNALVVGRFYHVAVTYTFGTASSMKMYVNGNLVSGSWTTGTGSTAVSANSSIASIGSINGTNQNFNGTVDDVRVYNRVLSSGEINKLYQMGR